MSERVPRAIGRDWFIVDWGDVWDRLRLAPGDCPGVIPCTAPTGWRFAFPHKVHLTHLRVLAYPAPRIGSIDPLTQPPGVVLRPHQLTGINFIRTRRGTLLADEQRVGKSPQIMYAHEPGDGTLLVVGPLAARAVWHEWAARRFGGCWEARTDGGCSICHRVDVVNPNGSVSFVALSGRKLDEAQLAIALRARVIFVHFAIVPTWRELFAKLDKIGTLAVDEAHKAGIQNRRSLTIESIRFLNTVARRVIFATGTPLYNRPKGLWPILDIITPGAFGFFWDFARRYCDARPGAHGWTAEGATRQDELRQRLREVMLRRTWAEIAPGLPPINRALEVVTLSDSKRDDVEELAARVRSQTGNAKTAVGDLARLRKLYAAEKITAAIQWIKETLAAGRSCIAWCWHRSVAESLRKLCVEQSETLSYLIHGETPPDEREEAIEFARSASAARPIVLIATMATLDTAVNLSFAQHELFVELDWNPPTIAQAEMRPFDGVHPVSATYLVADCSVDQKLADALLTKLGMQDALGLSAGVGSVEAVLRESLGVEDAQTLSALADAVMSEAV